MKSFRNGVSESFWTADAMLIGLLTFFIVVGAMDPLDSLPLAVVLLTLVGLWLMHAITLRREAGALTTESRRIRERRGF
jgi:uncharacterized membrane protein